MKKFLLLLVGVLFALSADAWTLYFDIKDTGWSSAPYIYCGKLKNSSDYNSGATYYNRFQLTHVYGTLYKWNQTWDGLTTIFISKTDLGNPDGYNGTDLSNYATELNGTDANGQFTTASSDNWQLVDNRLYVLYSTGNNGASSVTDNYTPAASKDIYIVGSNPPLSWDLPSAESKFTRTGEYTYEYNFTGKTFNGGNNPSEFLILDGANWNGKHGTTNAGNKLTANTAYQLNPTAGENNNSNVKFDEDIANPTVVVDVQNWTVTFKTATTPDPDPTPDYSGRTIALSGGFYNPAWPGPVTDKAKKFTFVSGSTYTLDLSGYTFDANTEFKIYDVTGISDTKNWGQGYWNNNTAIQPGVAATLTGNNTSGNNIKVSETIVEPQFTLDVSTWTLTISPKAVTPSTYSYRFHSNMVNGTWPADDNNDPAWKMTEQSDGTWMWQGSLTASGAFGFKRLAGDEAPGKNNQWIYCSSNPASPITLGKWSGAKLKANNTDTSGADWTFTPDGGTYQVIFDPANMQTKIVKVSTTVDYSGRKYVISGTFNGWIAPADNITACRFRYEETGENAGKYVWSYTGLMKNVEFKICDLTNLAEDSDKKWGKAYGTTYTGSTRDELTAGTPGTPGTSYNMRRTNVPGEDVLIATAELYNPTFVLDPATMTLTVINNPVTANYKYGVHSNFSGSWECVAMTEHADGSWSYTCAIPKNKEFGIRQVKKEDNLSDDSKQTAWVSSNGTAAVTVATPDATKHGGSNWTTGNDAFNGTIYTIVFTPAKNTDGSVKTDGTGTLVIYNNTAVDATIQPAMAENGTDYLIVDGQKANEIVVKVPVANYLGTSEGEFSLSMGDNTIATAKAVDGNVTFEYLPYLSGTREFTLKGADKAVKLNVNSPELAGSYFTLDEYKSLTLVANENGYIDVAVACEPTSTLVYDIPIWYYTIGDYTYEAEEVYWSTNGFSFNVKNLAEYDPSTYKAKEEGIATCYGTPIFPFVVRKAASTLAEEESNLTIQQFGGSKASFQVKIQVNDGVSGVEGVAVENEDAPVEYYNLQGQRVNGDLAPGIYIRRQGTTVTKVRI